MSETTNSTEPLISCVIPVYNMERFLAEAILSILGQTYNACEIIVVDDGSTDNSVEVARSFARHGVILLQQANAGSASARNKGIGSAAGKFIALLDADDKWLPEKLALQMKKFQDNPKLAVCTTHMQNLWEPEVAHEAEQNPHLKAPQPGIGSTFVGRAETFTELGLFDETLRHRDVQEFCMRAKLGGWDLCLLDEVLVHRRIHETNESRSRVGGSSELLDMASQLLAARRVKPE